MASVYPIFGSLLIFLHHFFGNRYIHLVLDLLVLTLQVSGHPAYLLCTVLYTVHCTVLYTVWPKSSVNQYFHSHGGGVVVIRVVVVVLVVIVVVVMVVVVVVLLLLVVLVVV